MHSSFLSRRLGGVRVSDITLASEVRPPWHDHEGAHICAVTDGGFEERLSRGWRSCIPSTVRHSPVGDRHLIRSGRSGLRCIVIEAPGLVVPTVARRIYVENPRLARLAVRARDELRAEPEGSPLLVEGLVLEMFAQLTLDDGRRRRVERPRWLTAARDFLHDAPATARLAELAAAADRHPMHVARAFREHYGCSVGDYARRVQIERAWHRIVSTDEPLGTIAHATGFADQSHMTRLVKRALGRTPSELRRAATRRPTVPAR